MMDRKLTLTLFALLLVALVQQCESCTVGYIIDDWAGDLDRAYRALKELDFAPETSPSPDEVAATIQAAADRGIALPPIFQPLSSAIPNDDNQCPPELIRVLGSFVRITREWPSCENASIVTPISRFLKEKYLPKLNECVSSIVATYTDRKELDVLKPLDEFFEAAYGPGWPARLPKIKSEHSFYGQPLNAEDAITHINSRDSSTDASPDKIERFLDNTCNRIQAFAYDVITIELVNAIKYKGFGHECPVRKAPPEARELPNDLLKIKQYFRICSYLRDELWTFAFKEPIRVAYKAKLKKEHYDSLSPLGKFLLDKKRAVSKKLHNIEFNCMTGCCSCLE
jgi:hypothetical protein